MAIKLGQATVREQNFSQRESVNSSAEDFGAGDARQIGQLGKITQKFGHEAAKMYQDSEDKKTRAGVRDTLTSAQGELRERLTAVYSQQGRDASESMDEYDFITDAVKKKYSKDMSPDETALFTHHYQNYSNRHGERVFNHKLKQDGIYESQSKQGKIDGDILDGIQFRHSELDVQANLQNIKLDTASLYRSQGSEVVDVKTREATNKMFTGMIEAEKDNPESALEMAEYHKDKFLDYEKIKSDLVDHKINKDRQNEASVKISEREWTEDQFDKVMADPFSYNVPIGAGQEKGSQDEFQAMRSGSVLKVIAYKKTLMNELNGSKKGKSPKSSDMAVYSRLINMTPEEFSNTDLTQKKYRDSLTSSHLKGFMDDKKKGSSLSQSAKDLLKYKTDSFPMFKDKEGKFEGSRLKGQLYVEFKKELDKLKPEEKTDGKIKEIVNDLFLPHIVYDEYFDGKKQQTRFSFEVPYIQDQDYKKAFNKKIVAEKIKNRDGVTTDGVGNYFIMDGETVNIHKKDGTLIKTQRRKKPVSKKVTDAK